MSFAGNPNNTKYYRDFQIGEPQSLPYLGALVTYSNGEQWLRGASAVPAGQYPDAAQCSHLKIVGLTSSFPSTVTNAYKLATNNAGTWVAAIGSSTNIALSTNNGLTWSFVAHNAGGQVNGVVWDSVHSLFITCGNSTTTFFTSTSPTGAVWTVRTPTTFTGSTANYATIATDGAGNTVMATVGVISSGISYSTNGTTWTAKNYSSGGTTGSPAVAFANSTWLIVDASSLFCWTSPDATTWTRNSIPLQPNRSPLQNWLVSNGSKFYYITSSNNIVTYSSDGVNWNQLSMGNLGQIASTFKPNSISYSNGNFHMVSGLNYVYTSDFVSYNFRSLPADPSNFGEIMVDTSNNMIVVGNSFNPLYSSVWPAANYVGVNTDTPGLITSNSAMYYKIKNAAV